MTPMRWQATDPFAGLVLHATATFSQNAFRFRNDDGTETSATWIDAENVDPTFFDVTNDHKLRLRIAVQETAGGAVNNDDFTLQYQINAGAWTDVDNSTTSVVYVDSAFVPNQTATTSQLVTPTGAFAGGAFVSESGSAARISFNGSDYGENEYSLNLLAADLADGDVINFRLLRNGATLASYAQVPTVTVSKALAISAAPVVNHTQSASFTYTRHDHVSDAVVVNHTQSATVTYSATQAPTSTLPVLSGLVLDLDASAITGLSDTQAVPVWDDQSGLGNDATQATGTAQPTYRTGVLNGMPAVRYDGLDDYSTVARGVPSVHTIFVVLARRTTKALMGFFETSPAGVTQNTSPNTLLQFDSADLRHYNLTVAYQTVDTTTVDTPYLLTVDRTATPERSAWLNGVSKFSNLAATDDGDNIQINLGVGYNDFAQVDYAQFVVYDRVLTTQERQDVETHLTAKWLTMSVSASIAVNHTQSVTMSAVQESAWSDWEEAASTGVGESFVVNHTQSVTSAQTSNVPVALAAAHTQSVSMASTSNAAVSLTVNHNQAGFINTSASSAASVSIVVNHNQTAAISHSTAEFAAASLAVDHTQAAAVAYTLTSEIVANVVVNHTQAVSTVYSVFDRPRTNFLPSKTEWVLTQNDGEAYFENGRLVLKDGATASITVYTGGGKVWQIAAVKTAYTQGPTADPGLGGFHWTTQYFGADGVTPEANAGGWFSNGNASVGSSFLELGKREYRQWSTPTDGYEDIHFIRFNLFSDSTYASSHIEFDDIAIYLADSSEGLLGHDQENYDVSPSEFNNSELYSYHEQSIELSYSGTESAAATLATAFTQSVSIAFATAEFAAASLAVNHTQSAAVSYALASEVATSLTVSHTQTVAAVHTANVPVGLSASHTQAAAIVYAVEGSLSASFVVNNTQSVAMSSDKSVDAALADNNVQSAALAYTTTEFATAVLAVAHTHAVAMSYSISAGLEISLTVNHNQSVTLVQTSNVSLSLAANHTQSSALVYALGDSLNASFVINHAQSAAVTYTTFESASAALSVDHTHTATVNYAAAESASASFVDDHTQSVEFAYGVDKFVSLSANNIADALVIYGTSEYSSVTLAANHTHAIAVAYSTSGAFLVSLAVNHTQDATLAYSTFESTSVNVVVGQTQTSTLSYTALETVGASFVASHAHSVSFGAAEESDWSDWEEADASFIGGSLVINHLSTASLVATKSAQSSPVVVNGFATVTYVAGKVVGVVASMFHTHTVSMLSETFNSGTTNLAVTHQQDVAMAVYKTAHHAALFDQQLSATLGTLDFSLALVAQHAQSSGALAEKTALLVLVVTQPSGVVLHVAAPERPKFLVLSSAQRLTVQPTGANRLEIDPDFALNIGRLVSDTQNTRIAPTPARWLDLRFGQPLEDN